MQSMANTPSEGSLGSSSLQPQSGVDRCAWVVLLLLFFGGVDRCVGVLLGVRWVGVDRCVGWVLTGVGWVYVDRCWVGGC